LIHRDGTRIPVEFIVRMVERGNAARRSRTTTMRSASLPRSTMRTMNSTGMRVPSRWINALSYDSSARRAIISNAFGTWSGAMKSSVLRPSNSSRL
jgi:hypothetical protein